MWNTGVDFLEVKTFNILVNEEVIATENISNIRDGQWIDIEYPIAAKLTKGKSKVTVKFNAFYGHMAGPVFGVRTLLVPKVKTAGNREK